MSAYGRDPHPSKLTQYVATVASTNGVNRLNAFVPILNEFNLKVWQWKGHGPVGDHSNASYHYQVFSGTNTGRAFDSHKVPPATVKNMMLCAKFLNTYCAPYLTEGIFQGPRGEVLLSVKNGARRAPVTTWTLGVWNEHKNHIHIAV